MDPSKRNIKGFIKDEDRFTKAHQEISLWFSEMEHIKDFIRKYFFDYPSEIAFKQEIPLRNERDMIIGYPDCIIDYLDMNGNNQRALLEFKSYLSDIGRVKRQIETYQAFLENITRRGLVYMESDEDIEDRENAEEQSERLCKYNNYFENQSIRFVKYDEMKLGIESIKKQDSWPSPIGRSYVTMFTVDCKKQIFDKITVELACRSKEGSSFTRLFFNDEEEKFIKQMISFFRMRYNGYVYYFDPNETAYKLEAIIESYEPSCMFSDWVEPLPIISCLIKGDEVFHIPKKSSYTQG